MKRGKFFLASLVALLIIVGLSQPASAPEANPDLVIDPDEINVSVSSTFTIDIWIKNIPSGFVMLFFDFQVSWESSMMELTSHNFLADENGWSINADNALANNYFCAASGADWSSDSKWLTLTFHCLAEGSSTIQAAGSGSDSVVLWDGNEATETGFDSDAITCNQRRPVPPTPYHYVGGELFTANKLAVLSPYLALIGIVTTVAILIAAPWKKTDE